MLDFDTEEHIDGSKHETKGDMSVDITDVSDAETAGGRDDFSSEKPFKRSASLDEKCPEKDIEVVEIKEEDVKHDKSAAALNKKLCDCVTSNKRCTFTDRGKFCSFAHKVDELRPDICDFGLDCYRINYNSHGTPGFEFDNKSNKPLCRLIHTKKFDSDPSETFDNYIWRLGYHKFKGVHVPKVGTADDRSDRVDHSSPREDREEHRSSDKRKFIEEDRNSKKKKAKYTTEYRHSGSSLVSSASVSAASASAAASSPSRRYRSASVASDVVVAVPARVLIPVDIARETFKLVLEKRYTFVEIRIDTSDPAKKCSLKVPRFMALDAFSMSIAKNYNVIELEIQDL